MNKRCSGIRGKLKEYTRYNCHICANQQANIAEDFPNIKLNSQSLEFVEKFCYLGDTIETGWGALGSVITRVKGGWSKFKHLVPLLTCRGLPLGIKGRLYSSCVHRTMLYESETYPFKEEDVIRLKRND